MVLRANQLAKCMQIVRHKIIVSYGLHWPQKMGDSEGKMKKNSVNIIINDVLQAITFLVIGILCK
jgi:hypothetical protein